MQTFSKPERLCSLIAIDKLIEKGKSFHHAPFKFIWLAVPEGNFPVQIVISVPKRLFKRAVDRNLLKRRIRESYRKNKSVLTENMAAKNIHLMVIYTTKTILEYREIEEKLIKGLTLLKKGINQ